MLPASASLLLIFSSVAFAEAPATIGTDELVIKTRASKVAGPVIVDVRSWVEYQDGHIPGAIHIPSESISERLPEKIRDKSRALVFYCGGPRCPNSRQAAEAAKDIGYRSVRVYQEGLSAWEAAKHKTVASSALPVIDPVFVSADEVIPVIERKKRDAVIVDVRTRKEYSEFHLQNSVNIPLDELEDKSKRLSGKKVIFVCHAGGQSIMAARVLSKSGRKDMCVLRGGLVEWQRTHQPHLEGKNP